MMCKLLILIYCLRVRYYDYRFEDLFKTLMNPHKKLDVIDEFYRIISLYITLPLKKKINKRQFCQ